MKCIECRYWGKEQIDPFAKDHFCHRHAPQVIVKVHSQNSYAETVWPRTLPEDWCGEFAVIPVEDTRPYLEAVANG